MSTAGQAAMEGLRRGVVAIEAIRPLLRNVSESIEVDRWEFSGAIARIADIPTDDLLALSTEGHAVEIRAAEGGWELAVRAEGAGATQLEMHGRPEMALPQSAITPMERATARGDASEALRLAGDVAGRLSITLINSALTSGAHWIPSSTRLMTLLTEASWSKTVRRLAEGPPVLVVEDAHDSSLETDGFTVIGPSGVVVSRGPSIDDTGYRKTLSQDGRSLLPSPGLFSNPVATAAFQELVPVLHGVTRSLVWYWLSSRTIVTDDGLAGEISGARTVTFPLTPSPIDSAGDDLALFRWAAAIPDPARYESMQQAASLAMVSGADLPTAAGPALRTARSLYELARRGAVGEALAARRGARDAAMNAARQAAFSARGAASKAVERALVQLAATAAVVVSKAADIISAPMGWTLLAAIAVTTVVTLVVTFKVELASASGGLDSELADLEQYRDTLSSDDIGAIRNASAVRSARSDLTTARHATAWVLGGTAALVLAAGVLVQGLSSPQGTKQSPPVGPTKHSGTPLPGTTSR